MNLKSDNFISFMAKLIGGAILFAVVFQGKISEIDYSLPIFCGPVGVAFVFLHNLLKTNKIYPAVSFKFSNFLSLFYLSVLTKNIFAAVCFFILGLIIFDLFNFKLSIYSVMIYFVIFMSFTIIIDRFEMYSYKKLLQKRGVFLDALENH